MFVPVLGYSTCSINVKLGRAGWGFAFDSVKFILIFELIERRLLREII
jgi:hypothetical protein